MMKIGCTTEGASSGKATKAPHIESIPHNERAQAQRYTPDAFQSLTPGVPCAPPVSLTQGRAFPLPDEALGAGSWRPSCTCR